MKLTDEMTDKKPRVLCLYCRSRWTVRNGRHPATNMQKILCRKCGRSFRTTYIYQAYKIAPKTDRRLQSPTWICARPQQKHLDTVPVGLDEANAFIFRYHRHHPPVVGYRFAIGLSDGEKLVGVVIVGRPVSRHLDDGVTLEVTRCCTDGTRNAPSLLYAAARRAAFALGYKKIITYTLAAESGVTLQAAGWQCTGPASGGSWNAPSRPRQDKHPTEPKQRWEARPMKQFKQTKGND